VEAVEYCLKKRRPVDQVIMSRSRGPKAHLFGQDSLHAEKTPQFFHWSGPTGERSAGEGCKQTRGALGVILRG
jgi:hypothetical protein